MYVYIYIYISGEWGGGRTIPPYPSPPNHLEKSPHQIFIPLLLPDLKSIFPPTKQKFPIYNPVKMSLFAVVIATVCTIFVLISYSGGTQVMLILILINVQYSQTTVFSFEKCSNHQNHCSSDSYHPVKKLYLYFLKGTHLDTCRMESFACELDYLYSKSAIYLLYSL